MVKSEVEKSGMGNEKNLADDVGVQEVDENFLHVADGRADGVDVAYEVKVAMINHALQHEIGMGRYQWQLFLLSGFGWLADNLWLQGVAIILPQVQLEFNPTHISMMTLALYVGLILGATTWGILSDIIGRRVSWNATLAIGGVFGIAAGAAPNFVALGALLACLGFESVATCQLTALCLSFVPASHQWLLTLLSVFWSFGQLLASLVAWAFIANYSCSSVETCTHDNNMGWRYTFYTMGALTFAFFILRFLVFDLQESPKFLVAKGRDEEAIATLSHIAIRNGRTLELTLEKLQGRAFKAAEIVGGEADVERLKHGGATSNKAILMRSLGKMNLDHVRPLFKGRKMAINTTILIILWGLIGCAYPLYNAFLPLYLQAANAELGSGAVSETYRNYSIISVCGIPGSILACFLVEWRAKYGGRRFAMAISTLLTGVFLFLFTTAKNEAAVLGWNCASGLTQNAMYGVLYAYTPEVFPAPHRGTGDGICSTFNRICGLMAPIIKSFASSSDPNAPLFVSASLFVAASLLMVGLPIETAGVAAL